MKKQAAKKIKPLTDKQKLFVAEYLVDMNGGKAAIRAGFSERTARVIAYELLQDPRIQEALQAAMEERAKRVEITADRVLREAARVGLSDIRRLFNESGAMKPINELDDDISAAVASVEVFEEFEGSGSERVSVGQVRKIKLWDKNPALDKLMKHLGMFEKNNAQVVDPLVELLKGLSGKVMTPVKDVGDFASHDEDGDDD